MADVDSAIDFVLRQEDSRLLGAITTQPADRGGPTRFGLASTRHPELVELGYYQLKADGAPLIGQCAALDEAEDVYKHQYAAVLLLDQVLSQDVANLLLSFAINEGAPEAVRIAQRALNTMPGIAVTVDGMMGPSTLDAVNGCDPAALIAAERLQQEIFYRQLVAEHPEYSVFLTGWLNRTRA